MRELDPISVTELGKQLPVLALMPGPKTEGGRNTYWVELAEVPKGVTYQLVDPEGKPLCKVTIHDMWNQLAVVCGQCPKLKPADTDTRYMNINPYNGHARQRLNEEDTLIIHGECLRYKPLHLSRKQSAKDNKHRKWLGETRRDRHYGFVK